MRKASNERSRSPRANSRPLKTHRHVRRKSASLGHFPTSDDGEDFHKSELNVFQQLCLDRHDDNAAIEILLGDSGPAKDVSGPAKDVSKIKAPCEASTKVPPRAPEGRKSASFFNRWFKSSPRKASAEPPAVVPSITKSISSDLDDRYCFPPPLPPAPSTVRRSRSFKDLSPTVRVSNCQRVRTDDFDTFSSMSSLSGSKATTVMSHRRNLGKPLKLDRHESLGMNSIMDIRNTLKVMERQLDKASNNGERVSRQKVMKALFTVADSLENLEEREMIRGELRDLMEVDSQVQTHKRTNIRPVLATITDESSKENYDNFIKSTTSKKASDEKVTSPFHLFSSMGKMFTVSQDERKAVEKALDDLLWTEFVASRKERERTDGRAARNVHDKTKHLVPRKTTLEVKQPPRHNQVLSDRTNTKSSAKAPAEMPSHSLTRSWWGTPANAKDSRRDSSSSSSSSSSWAKDEDLDAEDDDFGELEEDCEDSDSEENLKYLPTSITVRKPQAQPLSPLGQSYAFSPQKNSFKSVKPAHSRYRVRMVDTESRVGFEMGSTCLSQM